MSIDTGSVSVKESVKIYQIIKKVCIVLAIITFFIGLGIYFYTVKKERQLQFQTRAHVIEPITECRGEQSFVANPTVLISIPRNCDFTEIYDVGYRGENLAVITYPDQKQYRGFEPYKNPASAVRYTSTDGKQIHITIKFSPAKTAQ